MLNAFFRSVWPETDLPGDTAAADSQTIATLDLGNSPSVVAVDGERVIGYLGTLPLRLWDGTAERPGHWFKGFMVLPEFRNGPIGFGLVKEAIKHVPIALVITVQPASWRLFKAMGMTHVGVLQNRLRLLNPTRVLATIDIDRIGLPSIPRAAIWTLKLSQRVGIASAAGAVARSALAGWSLLFGSRSRGTKTEVAQRIDYADYDKLWTRSRTTLRFSQVRDGEYVRSRYGNSGRGDESPYVLLEARDDKDLIGFAAVRRPRRGGDPRLPGLAVAVLADMLVAGDRTDAIYSLLAGAERTAHDLGTDALICSASHPWLLTALSARGYVRIPATLQFLARFEPSAGGKIGPLSDWWLLRADGNADEGF